MNKALIGIVAALVLFVSGILVGRYKFVKTEIKIIEKEVTKTEYKVKVEKVFDQTNFDNLLKCYDSPITFTNYTKDNYLFVKAEDLCKDAEVKYEIKSAGNYKFYIGLSAAGLITGAIVYKYRHKIWH